MSQEYFQIEGWRGDVKWPNKYNDYTKDYLKLLADSIAGPKSRIRPQSSEEPVELVLGIKRTGASYLYFTLDETRRHAQANMLSVPRNRGLDASQFESLSPISFQSAVELRDKLSTMTPKSKKNKDSRALADTSLANTAYKHPSTEGIKRGIFENNRVLYRVLQGTLDHAKYSISGVAQSKRDIRICSITYNTWSLKDRSRSDMLKAPKILDVGFAEATIPNLEYKAGSGMDMRLDLNLSLQQGKGTRRQDFRYGSSLSLSPNEIGSQLRGQLRGSSQSTILLAMGEEWTTAVLAHLDVHFEVKPIVSLLRNNHDRDQGSSSSDYNRRNDYEGRRDRPRERSKSPRRSYTHSSAAASSGAHDPRSRNSRAVTRGATSSTSIDAQDGPSKPTIYLVDVRALYLTMMQEGESDAYELSVLELAQRLGVADVKLNEWCAGNEAVLLIELWKLMVSGPPIDEQRKKRLGDIFQVQNVAINNLHGLDSGPGNPSANTEGSTDGDDDDDDDPNNWVEHSQPVVGNANPVKTTANIDPDDLDDFGTDEDSD